MTPAFPHSETDPCPDNMNGMEEDGISGTEMMTDQHLQYEQMLAERDSKIKALEEVQTKMQLQLVQEQSSRSLRESERNMASYLQQIDELKQKLERSEALNQVLISERDQALEDLRNVESAFSDVHRKYERVKGMLESLKQNEDILKQRDYEMQIKIDNRDKKLEALKQKCQDTLENMHQDYESRLKNSDVETHKLRALLRKTEMKIDSLENDLEQKGRENSQLSTLCDELINGRVSK